MGPAQGIGWPKRKRPTGATDAKRPRLTCRHPRIRARSLSHHPLGDTYDRHHPRYLRRDIRRRTSTAIVPIAV